MPTRTYYYPKDFNHIREILNDSHDELNLAEFEKFSDSDIAPLLDINSLPSVLAISPRLIKMMGKNSSKHYRFFQIRKKSGKPRDIYAPRTYLKVVQWWIYDNILGRVQQPDHVFGFVKGRNIQQNAEYHFGAKHLLNVDIEDFFPTITREMVIDIFIDLGYCREVSEQLSDICCLDGTLPQGAPTSPAIANIVFSQADKEIASLSVDYGIKYSRYADDLSFSSTEFIPEKILASLKSIVETYGFQLKTQKTRFVGTGGQMEVTGLLINEVIQPKRTWRKKVRASIHQLSKKKRLSRRDISYLYGIKGMCLSDRASYSMKKIGKSSEDLLTNYLLKKKNEPQNIEYPNGLTRTEANILLELNAQTTNRNLANMFFVSESTIKVHLRSVYKKIGVKKRKDAEQWANANL